MIHIVCLFMFLSVNVCACVRVCVCTCVRECVSVSARQREGGGKLAKKSFVTKVCSHKHTQNNVGNLF